MCLVYLFSLCGIQKKLIAHLWSKEEEEEEEREKEEEEEESSGGCQGRKRGRDRELCGRK